MLRNLHLLFREQRDLERWRDVVELSLRLEPWNAALTGERGMLNYRLGAFAAALEDLDRYVRASGPEMVSAGARKLLEQLRTTHGNEEGQG